MLTELRAIEHAKRDAHATEPLRRPRLGAALAIATLVVLAIGLIGLPRDNASLPDIARYALEIALPQWKTTEPVNEIVYGSRGFDTFGETFLLLAAVVSVVTLARPREPRREYVGEAKAGEGEQARIDPDDDRLSPSEAAARRAEQVEEAETGEFIPADRIPLGTRGAERSPEMSVVVRIAARTVARLLAVTAVYLVAWGYSPGGGFPGGAALAGVVVLLYAALGYRRVRKVVRPGERCCRPSTVCSWTQPAAAATPVGFAAPLSHNRGISTSRRTVLRRCTLQSPRPYRICDTSNGSSITPA